MQFEVCNLYFSRKIKAMYRILILLTLVVCISFSNAQPVKVGAECSEQYLPQLNGKKIGVVVNQTSMVNQKHLVDFLLANGVKIGCIFAPEHGFRGTADAGEHINSGVDSQTGLPVVSLYGDNKKPTSAQLAGLDALVYDIQDVGCRFYTYISTLHYVMEACAENNIPLWVFDRPNPNGDYVAGPVLDKKFSSFVGVDPIPVVYGCTPAELARMINGEGWLANQGKCDLKIIPVQNYTHKTPYELPVKPSPNLPNYLSVRIYPSLCFFEATSMSVGRGTMFPFQVVGYPDPKFGSFSFTPESIEGMDKNPKYKGQVCYGADFRTLREIPRFTLKYFFDYYKLFPEEKDFLTSERWFNLLAGTDQVLAQYRQEMTLDEIENSWKPALSDYLRMRKKYLLYPDFE